MAGDIIDVNTLNPSKCLSASPFYPNNNKIQAIMYMYTRKMKMRGGVRMHAHNRNCM